MKGRKVTVLLVPDFEGTPHTFKMSVFALRLGLALGILGILLFFLMLFTWGGIARKANLAERLAAENDQYRHEQQRVLELEARVQQLRQFEEQIRRALGSDFSTTGITDKTSTTALIPGEIGSEVEPFQESDKVRGSQPVVVRSTIQFEESVVSWGDEYPSLWPVEGFISRGFEWNPVVPSLSHPGVDIAGKQGAAVRATAGGIVVWCGWSARYGNMVVLAHGSKYFSVYGHNQILLVQPRQRVERGDPIALLGNTGQSSAPHLHFEIWLNDQPLNPLDMLITS